MKSVSSPTTSYRSSDDQNNSDSDQKECENAMIIWRVCLVQPLLIVLLMIRIIVTENANAFSDGWSSCKRWWRNVKNATKSEED